MSKEDPVDKGMKILARKHPESFLDLIFRYKCDYSLNVIEDPVLNIPEKRADSIYILQKDLKNLAIHIDFQLIPSDELLKRVFLYNALFTEKLDMPVCSVVIYPEKGNYATFPDEYRIEVSQDLWNSFFFKAIKLWEYRDEIESGKLPGLSPLLVLLEKNPDEKTLEKERYLINKIKNEKERADLFSVAITVASRKFTREFLYKFFKEEMSMLKEWDIVQEWIKEGELKGLKQGKEEVIKELIKELLENKLTYDPEMEDILKNINDVKLLKIVFRKAIKINSLDELKAFAKDLI